MLRLSLFTTESDVEARNDSIISCFSHLVSVDIVRVLLTASEVKQCLTQFLTISFGDSSLFHKADERNDTSSWAHHKDRGLGRLRHDESRIFDEYTGEDTRLELGVDVIDVSRSPAINFRASGISIPF